MLHVQSVMVSNSPRESWTFPAPNEKRLSWSIHHSYSSLEVAPTMSLEIVDGVLKFIPNLPRKCFGVFWVFHWMVLCYTHTRNYPFVTTKNILGLFHLYSLGDFQLINHPFLSHLSSSTVFFLHPYFTFLPNIFITLGVILRSLSFHVQFYKLHFDLLNEHSREMQVYLKLIRKIVCYEYTRQLSSKFQFVIYMAQIYDKKEQDYFNL